MWPHGDIIKVAQQRNHQWMSVHDILVQLEAFKLRGPGPSGLLSPLRQNQFRFSLVHNSARGIVRMSCPQAQHKPAEHQGTDGGLSCASVGLWRRTVTKNRRNPA